jgi:hypothetical protein
MRFALFVLCLFLASVASAQETSVLVTPAPAMSGFVSAQDHADYLASSGSFGHCSRRGGGYEGLGFSTVSPTAAIRRSCFWGQRRVREVATAWCPTRRGWVAVVRYY